MTVKGYVDHIEVVADGQVVARHDRCCGRGAQILDPIHYLVTLGRRPGARLQELDRPRVTQAEIQAIVTDAARFLSSLKFTLHQGLPQEKLTAVRQCLTCIHINRPTREIKLTLRAIPIGNLDTSHQLTLSLAQRSAQTGR